MTLCVLGALGILQFYVESYNGFVIFSSNPHYSRKMHSFDPLDLSAEEDSGDAPPPRLASQLLDTYCKLVRHDPVTFRAVESLLCSVSYMATSRWSSEVTEMFFMASNLLRYANDHLLQKKRTESESEETEHLEVRIIPRLL